MSVFEDAFGKVAKAANCRRRNGLQMGVRPNKPPDSDLRSNGDPTVIQRRLKSKKDYGAIGTLTNEVCKILKDKATMPPRYTLHSAIYLIKQAALARLLN